MKEMKIYSKHDYKDNHAIRVDVRKFLDARLDYLELVLRNTRSLPSRYSGRALRLFTQGKLKNIDEVEFLADFKKRPYLRKNPELAKAFLTKSVEFLDIPGKIKQKGKTRVNAKNYLRSFLITTYYLAKALESVMPKSKAINHHKRLVDKHVRNRTDYPRRENVSQLLFKNRKLTGPFAHGFNYVDVEAGKGCAIKKIMRCKWHEVLKETRDPAFAYAVACHCDYAAARKFNPNFALTRTQTLTQGKKYCDFVWHDLRYSKKLAHPPKEYWDKLK
ncbi:L-2-amino-thiazoline-4-carboxylic acid hydrolase [Elusimicrobiota bacterium]